MPRSLPLPLFFIPLQGFSHELFQECSLLASCCYSSPAVSYYLQNKCVEIKKNGEESGTLIVPLAVNVHTLVYQFLF